MVIGAEQEHLHLAAGTNNVHMRWIVVIDIDYKAKSGFPMDHNHKTA